MKEADTPKLKQTKSKYYAVAKGKDPGIYDCWALAGKQVVGFKNSVHKRFNTTTQAEAFLKKYGITNCRYFITTPNEDLKSPSDMETKISTTPAKPDQYSSASDTDAETNAFMNHNCFDTSMSDLDSADTANQNLLDRDVYSSIQASPSSESNRNSCNNCTTLQKLIHQLVSRVDNLEAKIMELNQDEASKHNNENTALLLRRIDTMERQINRSYKDAAVSPSKLLSTPTISQPLRHPTNKQAADNELKANANNTDSVNSNRKRNPKPTVEFQPEKCVVIECNGALETFRTLNRDLIRKTLSTNHGPLIIDLINRYKFHSVSPKFIVQFSSQCDVTKVVENWKTDSFEGSTARATIKPSSIDLIGMVKGVPLDIKDNTIQEVINSNYTGSIFHRLYKDGHPLRTVKVTFADTNQVAEAIKNGLLLDSCNMLFRVEPPLTSASANNA